MSTATKRPRVEMELIAEELRELLGQACVKIEVAGSLRRGLPQIGDIELVAIPKIETYDEVDETDLFGTKKPVTYNLLWKALNGFFKGRYRLQGDKYKSFFWPLRGAGEGLVQVDLFTATPATWGWIFLVRTGSADFSHHVAKSLNKQGYTSKDGAIHKGNLELVDNKWQMVATGAPIATPTEEDVFRLAGIPIREPRQRF